jgi:tetratricopeptide (TPR) repeat protein
MISHRPSLAPDSDLKVAHRALRSGRAATAAQMLRQLLKTYPVDPNARWLLGVALLDLGKAEDSVGLLEELVHRADDFHAARVDLARAYRACGRLTQARHCVRTVLEKEPHHPSAWWAYGDVLVDLGQFHDARVAFERARQCEPDRQRTDAATAALLGDDRRTAERLFREILSQDPAHVSALCGLAALSLAADLPEDAERLLRHALRQSAHVPLAWRGLGPTLLSLGRLEESDAAARYLRTIEPDNPQSWIATAAAAARLLRQEDALSAYETAARLQPQEVAIRTSMGHLLKTLGRRAESEAAYQAAIAVDEGCAEAWWSLADLKNYVFTDHEVARMQALLERTSRNRSGDAQLHFALGKAFEQRADYDQAFTHYASGNALRREVRPFDAAAFERRGEAIRRFFNAEFASIPTTPPRREATPIFIVGLPRSGSTLLEQILASHPAVEGTMELPNILNLVRDIDHRSPQRDGYPEVLQALSPDELRSLGDRYLHETRPLRSGKPYFIDKLPNNFSHVGFIHAILPEAVIIDARRHPMDCCFSTFREHFAEGQTFSYDLTDLGRYYRAYLDLMTHWDAVLPGKVLRVQYEEVVADAESAIRRLLAHCGLPFDAACLAFHQTQRAVRTASAEQVRQPIYTSSIGYWRHFEAHLEPLRLALGDALDRYRR